MSDAGSRTGTLVNGEALASRRARLLRDGDRVTFGFGRGASRLLRYFEAGPEVGLGGTLLTVGVVVTVLGLVPANRPQRK
ncbi:FHA domain-containing protein [Amycolatopsis sp. NBC_00438]|uniref:FHA domain-containing protein n=1 Tax=Amycolatopsis sp. NBC_00438 TaxID=2903558 RepID=UPI002E23ACEE